MSCSRYHYLLSLNLDGRLSSSKRGALLDHLADCGACATLSDEMQSAHEMALSLPQERVGTDFTDTLWERIQSGEGTPEAVFDEPIPWATRVRYVASGAAAAALFLVALNWWSTATPTDSMTPTGEQTVARAEAQPFADSFEPQSEPESSTGNAVPFATSVTQSLQPLGVAEHVQRTAVRTVNELQTRAPALRKRLNNEPAPVVLREIQPLLLELKGAVNMMTWMVDSNMLDLPGALQAELRMAERGARLAAKANKDGNLAAALEQLDEVRTELLAQRFRVLCCDTTERFRNEVLDHLMLNPAGAQILNIGVYESDSMDGPSSGHRILQLRWLREAGPTGAGRR